MIHFTDFYVERKNTPTLLAIDLQIAAGEFIYFIGKSGSGKSTLLATIYGEVPYNAGSLKIDGKELSSFSFMELQDLRNNLGIIFQNNRLIEEWTIYENIAYKLEYQGLPQKVIDTKVKQWANKLNVGAYLNEFLKHLSGGEQQRVGIARALVQTPKVILADEPTANLDFNNGLKVLDILRELNAEGATVLMAIHNLKFIENSMTRTIKLDKGKIMYDKIINDYFIE